MKTRIEKIEHMEDHESLAEASLDEALHAEEAGMHEGPKRLYLRSIAHSFNLKADVEADAG